MHRHEFYWSLIHFSKFSRPFLEWSRVSYERESQGIYPFDGISTIFWFVHIPFGNILKFESLAQFPVDHFSHLAQNPDLKPIENLLTYFKKNRGERSFKFGGTRSYCLGRKCCIPIQSLHHILSFTQPTMASIHLLTSLHFVLQSCFSFVSPSLLLFVVFYHHLPLFEVLC